MMDMSATQIATICTVTGVVVMLVTIVVRQAVANTRNESSARAARAVADEAKLMAAGASASAALTAKDLAEFRERVAREYASRDAIREMEDKLVAAMNRIGERIDRWIDKEK